MVWFGYLLVDRVFTDCAENIEVGNWLVCSHASDKMERMGILFSSVSFLRWWSYHRWCPVS